MDRRLALGFSAAAGDIPDGLASLVLCNCGLIAEWCFAGLFDQSAVALLGESFGTESPGVIVAAALDAVEREI
jgi:hypothetical protein